MKVKFNPWFLALALPLSAWGATSQTPLFLTKVVDPRVMIAMSNDHQLSVKAYTDYSDLDGDGSLDTTYSDAITYDGYFDPDKCYTYVSANGRFEPQGAVDANGHQCSSATNDWSGNFLNWVSMTRMDMVRKVLYGGLRSADTATDTVLERALLPSDVHAFSKVFTTASTADMLLYTPYSATSLSFCNLTDASDLLSSLTTAAPIIRVATGAWPRWAAQEQTQCQWSGGTAPTTSERLEEGLNARVKVCVAGLREPNCASYGSSVKPTGLLQQYGETTNGNPIRFGLLTGSYQKNKSGGALRRNLEAITGHQGTDAIKNEIDLSNGTFINQGASDVGIIKTLNALRISSYDYVNGVYRYGCDSPGLLTFSDGSCVEWGNPLGEIYLETLRYLSGKSGPTPAFNANDTAYLSALPQVSWVDPMGADEHCADTSILTISTGLNSFDTDQLSNDLATGGGSLNVNNLTNQVGTLEGISGDYLVGETSGDTNKRCTSKSVTNLSEVKGVCPEVPSIEGGYQVAGLAYHARTADLRSDRTGDQTVTTYGVALAESLPSFEIEMGADSIVLLPACLGNSNAAATATDGGWRACSMTGIEVEVGTLTEGSLVVNWEDSTWGNDYDMDGVMRLEYCVGKSCPDTSIPDDNSVADNQLRVRTSALQAVAGHALLFGYTVAGSTNDGMELPILRPGGSDFVESDPLPADVTEPVTNTYTVGNSSARLLENPLWYAAKFGGFNELDGSAGPTSASEWDSNNDGVPDTYFQVNNPGELGASLAKVLDDVAKRVGSATAVTTSSTRLNTNTVAYQAKFNSGDWSGQLTAFPVNLEGTIGNPSWNASLPAHGSRTILSWDGSGGFAFNDSNLTTINTLMASAGVASLTSDQVNHLRGDQSQEESNNGALRNRAGLLGDIVNSDPVFVGISNFGYARLPSTEGTSYETFRNSSGYLSRAKMVYVGANDGMLHGFDASSGLEKMAFIPRAVYANLGSLTSPGYSHRFFVDGSPQVSDAYFDHDNDNAKSWRTVLVGTTGAGGSGVFALDVTEPSSFGTSNVLWEVDNSATGFSDLGDTIGEASIARLPDGDFYAVFGNGFNSSGGNAVIYLVNLDSPLSAPIVLDTKTQGTGNGMASPVVVDTDGDFIGDTIYAGDLKGNLWKAEYLPTSNANNAPKAWTFSFGTAASPQALFSAVDGSSVAQPITSKPAVRNNPAGGKVIYFGTGKYFEDGDNVVGNSPQVQTFYSIRDTGAQVTRSQLLTQQILAEGVIGTFNVRVTSDHKVTSQKGWLMDLKLASGSAAGERVVNQPILRGERVIFTTLIPSPDPCTFGGTSWLMEVGSLSGSRLSSSPFDVNEDGIFTDADKLTTDLNNDNVDELTPISGIQRQGVGIFDNPAVLQSNPNEVKILGDSSGNIESVVESSAVELGRQSWQQLQ